MTREKVHKSAYLGQKSRRKNPLYELQMRFLENILFRPSPPNRFRNHLSIKHLHFGFASVPPKVHNMIFPGHPSRPGHRPTRWAFRGATRGVDFGLGGIGVMKEIAGLGGKSGKDACQEEKERL